MLRTVKIPVTTTGADGSGAGTAYSDRPVNGEVRAIYVDWGPTAPGTSDITITGEGDDDHPAVALYTKADSVTDAWVYPVLQRTDTAGAGVSAEYHFPLVQGRIKVVIAGSNALAPAATVHVYIWE